MMVKNTNESLVMKIMARLYHTGGQCPCVSEKSWTEDTICPCKKMRDEDMCHCNLYLREEYIDK